MATPDDDDRAVLDALAGETWGMRRKRIVRRAHMHPNRVTAALRRLKAAGQVECLGRVRWRLVPDA